MRRLAAVIGCPIEHSLSPALHDAGFAAAGVDAVMVALEVARSDLGTAVAGMRALGFLGASVTVPHKCAVIDHCDRLDPAATAIGAVNCLVFEAGQVVGHNTDAAGFVDALAAATGQPPAGRAVLLGSGGAARAVTAGLRAIGVAVDIVARTPPHAEWAGRAGAAVREWRDVELHRALHGCDLLVDCTSAELSGPGLAAQLPLDRLPATATVASLIYHREPPLVAAARARGLRGVDGAGMLVHQAAIAFTLWTGRAAPVAAMTRALDTARGE